MAYRVDVIQAEPIRLAVVRLRATQPELSRVIPAACGEVWNFIRSHQIPDPGRHVAVYLDGVINIECGAEVASPFTGANRVVGSATPAGKVATTVHWGPYDRLGDAHEAITRWCAGQQLVTAGPNWEIYGHWTDDPSQLRTDVFYLLK